MDSALGINADRYVAARSQLEERTDNERRELREAFERDEFNRRRRKKVRRTAAALLAAIAALIV
jgi:hypothetical protein